LDIHIDVQNKVQNKVASLPSHHIVLACMGCSRWSYTCLKPLSWAFKWPAVRFVVACSLCTVHIHSVGTSIRKSKKRNMKTLASVRNNCYW